MKNYLQVEKSQLGRKITLQQNVEKKIDIKSRNAQNILLCPPFLQQPNSSLKQINHSLKKIKKNTNREY